MAWPNSGKRVGTCHSELTLKWPIQNPGSEKGPALATGVFGDELRGSIIKTALPCPDSRSNSNPPLGFDVCDRRGLGADVEYAFSSQRHRPPVWCWKSKAYLALGRWGSLAWVNRSAQAHDRIPPRWNRRRPASRHVGILSRSLPHGPCRTVAAGEKGVVNFRKIGFPGVKGH